MPTVGPLELIIVLVVVLLLFGSTKLPKLARSIGEASQEFKRGVSDSAKDGSGRSDSSDKGEAKADGGKPGETVTMSKADLDALIAEREAKARGESSSGD